MRNAISFLSAVAIAGAGGWLCGASERWNQEPPLPSPAASKVRTKEDPVPRVTVSLLSAAAVKARLDLLFASPARSSVELRLLMAQWVAADLEAAKQWMLEVPANLGGVNDAIPEPLMEFFKAWTRLDPAAAMSEAATLKARKGDAALRAVVAGLADADVGTIEAVLAKLPPGPNGPLDPLGVDALARQLAVRDLAGAQALTLALKGPRGAAAMKAVAEVLARTDPQAALAWAQQHPHESARAGAAEAALKEWARRDPAAVGPMLLQKADGQPDKFLAEVAVAALERLSGISPAEAAAFAEKFIPPEQVKANLSSLYRLLENNPDAPGAAAALCACVGRLSPAEMKDARLFPRGWPFYESIKPAWDRLLAEPDSPASRFLLGQMGQKLVSQRPAEIIQELMKLPDSALRDELLDASFKGTFGFNSTGSENYHAGIAELRSAVESMPESVRSGGALRFAWAVAGHDPRAAAEIMQQYPAVASDKDIIRNLGIRFMATSEPSEAQVWADSLPDEASKANAYDGIAREWYRQDSEAASHWVNSLPPGIGRDTAAAQLAESGARNSEPDTAFTWAASVQDPARRALATADVAGYWAKYNPQMVEALVTNSALSDNEKSELLRTINQRR